jgi:hypothetical protein
MAVELMADAEADQVAFVRRLGEAVRSGLEARARLEQELQRYERLGSAVLPALGRVAQSCAHEFDQAGWVVAVARTPRGAEMCSQALEQWLKMHGQACETLAGAASAGSGDRVRSALNLLKGAQPFAQQFNRGRQLLADNLAA